MNEQNDPIQAWVRIAVISMFLFSLCVEATLFLSDHSQSLRVFIPTVIFGIALFSLEALPHFGSAISQYEITTWVAFVAGAVALLILYLAIMETDPAKQSILSSFGSGLLGFATGIPFGKIKAAPSNVSRGQSLAKDKTKVQYE